MSATPSSSSRKEWQPRASLSEALSCGVNWLERARQKNCLAKMPCSLFVAYALPESPALGLSSEMSKLFRFSNRDAPETDSLRDASLRLLSVALKAHFFLAPGQASRHEPFVSSYPDPLNPGGTSVALVHRLDGAPGQPQAIVVGTTDLAFALPLSQGVQRFPVALSSNSYRWLERRKWETIGAKISEPRKSDVDACSRVEDFSFGVLLDFPFELKELVKLIGARWATGIQRWYLPHGYDVDAANEWIQRLSDELSSGGVERLERLFSRELGGRRIETWEQRQRRQGGRTKG